MAEISGDDEEIFWIGQVRGKEFAKEMFFLGRQRTRVDRNDRELIGASKRRVQ